MDKLLIEFAEKAGFYVEGDKVFCNNFDSIHELLENYAELVIQECCNACETVTTGKQPVLHLISIAYSQRIKEHFGME